MKTINKLVAILFMAIAMGSVFTACKKEEDSNGGQPSISYVRITRPQSSDSLLVGAGQGRLIAIMGENLKDAQEIWFNDQRASLNPTFITNTTIIVNVPAPIPRDITNKLKIVFKNGFVLLHDFVVQISEPVVGSMVSEYVNTG
ncbi:MAG TPA: IPT/TIG domain-containing protein, partial [Flavisolibacter sp.]